MHLKNIAVDESKISITDGKKFFVQNVSLLKTFRKPWQLKQQPKTNLSLK